MGNIFLGENNIFLGANGKLGQILFFFGENFNSFGANYNSFGENSNSSWANYISFWEIIIGANSNSFRGFILGQFLLTLYQPHGLRLSISAIKSLFTSTAQCKIYLY